jgi:hypothetical protein
LDKESEFGENVGAHGGVGNVGFIFFRIRWQNNLGSDCSLNPGALIKSAAQYFLDFDGKIFYR